MELRDYLRDVWPGSKGAFARRAGLHPAHLSQLQSGYRRASPVTWARIETATEGAVTREDLRPDLFVRTDAA